MVCDRYIDSTVAYQGVARGLGIELVEQLNSLVVGDCVPDLTFSCASIPPRRPTAARRGSRPASATARIASRREGVDFQRRVAAAYDELAERHPDRIVAIDAAGDAAPRSTRGCWRSIEERR